jgi:hypothetical protein
MMRTYGVFLALVGMLVALGFLLASTPREAYKTPAEELDPDAVDAGAALSDARAGDAAAPPAADAAASPPPVVPSNKLRLAVLSWELAAPVAGMDPAAVEATVLSSPQGVETRLARGGDDAEGADLAVVPLADFIGMYDRLRALEPSVVALAGFSHGKEELTAPGDAAAPKAGDTVGTSGDAAATMLAIYALDFMRTDVSKVKLVTDPADVANAAWVAAPRAATKKRIVLSSADASRLLPAVIIAPRRTREAKKADLVKFLGAWFEGTVRVRGNAPGVAKELEARRAPLFSAASEKPQGALAIVERLGQIEWSTAQDNADAFGVSDSKVAHVDELMMLSWRLLRTAGVVAASTPAQLPLTKDIVAEAAKVQPGEAPKVPAELLDDAGAPKGLNVLLTRKYDDLDETTLVSEIGQTARLFDHAVIRVTTRGGDKSSRTLVQKARKDSFSDRIYPGAAALGTSAAQIEVCVAP